MKTLKEIVELEKSVSDMLSELTSQIAKTTSETPMNGVKIVATNIASVDVMSLDHGILCPSYYLQSAQADMVERKLREAKTATEFISKIQGMIEEKKVKVNGEQIRLNPKTVEVLQSYLNNI
jgi:aromatic ring-opening dioxygenase LigB subunit